MARMKLRLDDLAVESFATIGGEGKRGTVHGHSEADPETDFLSCDCGVSVNITGLCCPPVDWGSASTCVQKVCGCTAAGGYLHGSCDVTCDTCNAMLETCAAGCMTHFTCPTVNGYQGC